MMSMTRDICMHADAPFADKNQHRDKNYLPVYMWMYVYIYTYIYIRMFKRCGKE